MGSSVEVRPVGWHCLELDLLDALALSRRLVWWLESTVEWTDGRARAEAWVAATAVSRAIGLALAEPSPRFQQDFLLIASGRAAMLRSSMDRFDPSGDLEEWQERTEDLCEGLEIAGLQRFVDAPSDGEIPW